MTADPGERDAPERRHRRFLRGACVALIAAVAIRPAPVFALDALPLPGLASARVGLAAMGAVLAALLALLWWRAVREGGSPRRGMSTFHAVLAQSTSGVVVADAASLAVLDANPAFLRMLGYGLGELRRLTLPDLISGEADAPGGLEARLRDPDPCLHLRVQLRCRNGAAVDAEVHGQRVDLGGRRAVAFTTSDATLRRKIEAQLLEKQQHLDHLAHHDQLTGLPNRHFLAAHMPGAIEEARRSGTMLAVLFLDLDRFKHINDTRGHETGDKLLKTVAQRVREVVRPDDLVVRMGGDEFIVVLKDVRDAERVSGTAGRINEALAAPVIVDGRPLVTTVSIGVSLYPRDGADMGELLRHSDTAMYQAKDRGRNNFQMFNPAMDRRVRERMGIETSLRAAMERGELDVHYQPIVDIRTRRVAALEALLRWHHPTHGAVEPGRFIGIAEETGLIVPIGEFVLNRVLEDAARWIAGGAQPVPVAVNISAVQLQRSDLHESIVRMTREHRLVPEMLQLELTESALFERREPRAGESAEDAITRLRELGVRIAIDDFGTGYSSLSSLKRWRVDYLKIDRSFVRDLVTDMNDLAIVGAIIAMARHMNIRVVAEGIEGWQQLEKLRQLGCALAQGYLIARPTPAAECHRFLTGRPLALTDDLPVEQALDATGS